MVEIRRYVASDFQDLARLVKSFYDYHWIALLGGEGMTLMAAEEDIREEMLVENSCIFVAEMDMPRKLIGFARYVDQHGVYFLREIFVVQEYQKKGIGSGLLEAIEKDIGKRGGQGLFLSVSPYNLNALSFFVRMGYDTLNMLELRKKFHEEPAEKKTVAIFGTKLKLA